MMQLKIVILLISLLNLVSCSSTDNKQPSISKVMKGPDVSIVEYTVPGAKCASVFAEPGHFWQAYQQFTSCQAYATGQIWSPNLMQAEQGSFLNSSDGLVGTALSHTTLNATPQF